MMEWAALDGWFRDLDGSHGVLLNNRPGSSIRHFCAHYIGQFHSPNPTARDFEECSLPKSNEKQKAWETPSIIPVHTEREISMHLGLFCNHTIPEAPDTLFWTNNLRRENL